MAAHSYSNHDQSPPYDNSENPISTIVTHEETLTLYPQREPNYQLILANEKKFKNPKKFNSISPGVC